MYKIAFFINLKKYEDILKRNNDLEIGNPGIGGTHYLYLLTVKYLNKKYGKDNAILLTDIKNLYLHDIPTFFCPSIEDALNYCEKEKIKFITVNANTIINVNENIFKSIHTKILIWGHNTIDRKTRKIAVKYESIYKIICVSKQQFLNMKFSKCFKKCMFINNAISEIFWKNSNVVLKENKNIVYIGSVFPQKGLHNLLKMWRKIEFFDKEVELFVVGGAKIWNPNLKTGVLGIGDKYYDKMLYKEYKKIKNKENIHFLGAMNWKDIRKIVQNCSIGVVNPSYYRKDETFCMSALELECFGIPVISRQRNDGLNTSIFNERTGYLRKNDKEIVNCINSLLNDKEKCEKMGNEAREYARTFIIDNEISKWNDIIKEKDNIRFNENIVFKKYFFDYELFELYLDRLLKIWHACITGKLFDKFFSLMKKRG